MSKAIPDADKKLSYDCLKCLLQQFEVNFRFRLAERLPKIRLVEKVVPLYISKLSISENGFKLKDTKYQLGVIRQAREGPNPESIEWDNQRGGSERDFDRFGFQIRSVPELTPGDILIQDYRPRGWHDDLELAEARVMGCRNNLTVLQNERMDLVNAPEELENVPETVVEQEHDQLDGIRDPALSREEQLEKINRDIGFTKNSLRSAEFDLLRYQCKRDNRPLPYDMSIKFTKKSPDGTVYIERFNYDKRLLEARKYLICKFLGNRQLVTKIKSLSFWGWVREGLVIGLPEGIKLDVQEFGTSGDLSQVLQRVETILEHPNRPFARLASDSLNLEDAQNPKVREAGVLALFDVYRLDYVALCREVPNKKIVITIGQWVWLEDYEMIVENLIDTKGTLGTCYEITQIHDEDKAKEVLRVIGKRYKNAVVEERLVTVPLPSELQLDVSYAPYQFNAEILLYTIKIEVVRRQTH